MRGMNESQQEESGLNLTVRDILSLLFKHKKKICLFMMLGLLGAAFLYFATPDLYLSEASFLVEAGRENINIIPTTDSDRAVTVNRSAVDVNNEIEIIRSSELYDELVDSIGVQTFMSEGLWEKIDKNNTDLVADIKDDIAKWIRKTVSVTNRRNTNIIIVEFAAANPVVANKVVAELIELFLRKHIAIHNSNAQYVFYTNQASATKASLDSVELEIERFNIEIPVNSNEENSRRLQSLSEEHDLNAAAIAAARSRIKFLNDKLESISHQPEESNAGDNTGLDRELEMLVSREHELASKYSENNAQLKEVRTRIQELRKKISSTVKDSKAYSPEEVQQLKQESTTEQANLTSLLASNAEIETLMNRITNNTATISVRQMDLERLKRQHEMLLDSYKKYTQSLEETRIDQIVQQEQISNIQILQSATLPRQPMKSDKLRNMLAVLMISIVGGVSIALASEYFNHTLKKHDDIEKWLQLRTLVVIPFQNK
jgi:polysaccharide biosynthesis protein PslE